MWISTIKTQSNTDKQKRLHLFIVEDNIRKSDTSSHLNNKIICRIWLQKFNVTSLSVFFEFSYYLFYLFSLYLVFVSVTREEKLFNINFLSSYFIHSESQTAATDQKMKVTGTQKEVEVEDRGREGHRPVQPVIIAPDYFTFIFY